MKILAIEPIQVPSISWGDTSTGPRQRHRLTVPLVLDYEGDITPQEVADLAKRIERGLVGDSRPPTPDAPTAESQGTGQGAPLPQAPSSDELLALHWPRSGRMIELDDSPRFDPTQAESFYQNLGRWKGPRAAPEVKAATEAFWLGSGREGAAWLVQRLRTESHIEPLHAAGSFLAALGEAALGPIIEGLAGQPAEDQGIALLRALGWMAEDPAMPRQPGDTLGLVILQFLNDDVADLREAAAGAALLLPPDRATRWLKSRLAVERDEDVLVTIREGLAGLGRGEV